MEELFNFNFKKQPSIQLDIPKTPHQDSSEEEEIKENGDLFNEIPPDVKKDHLPARQSLSSTMYQLNLSINVKKPRTRDSNAMVHSTMASLQSKRFSMVTPIDHSLQDSHKSLNTRTHTRHASLTYSKRNKYVSSFDGKSLMLSKVMRPSKGNDSSLIFAESKFGRVDLEPPGSGQLKGKSFGSPYKAKSNFAGINRKEKMITKENNGGHELCLTIKEEEKTENLDENEVRFFVYIDKFKKRVVFFKLRGGFGV